MLGLPPSLICSLLLFSLSFLLLLICQSPPLSHLYISIISCSPERDEGAGRAGCKCFFFPFVCVSLHHSLSPKPSFIHHFTKWKSDSWKALLSITCYFFQFIRVLAACSASVNSRHFTVCQLLIQQIYGTAGAAIDEGSICIKKRKYMHTNTSPIRIVDSPLSH